MAESGVRDGGRTGARGRGRAGGGRMGASRTGARILLAGGGTGGHLYPVLNLAEALRRAQPEVELLLLGAARGLEARVLPRGDLPFRLLPMQPLYRSRPWRNWRLLGSAPRVLGGVLGTLRSFDPEVVVGTGGYASGPAVLAARLTGRRTALQEQNARPGLVTRWLAPRVDQLHLGYPEAEAVLRPGRRTEVFAYGNPVAMELAPAVTPAPGSVPGSGPAAPRAPEWPEGRVVLVTGGSQGARGLNLRLIEDLESAASSSAGPTAGSSGSAFPPPDVSILWVAGPAQVEEISARCRRLPWANRIRVVPFIERLSARLSRVTLAVSRAGAMFVSELAAAGVPAVLVPFPSAAGGHQSDNARAMAEAGAAVWREEAELSPGRLWAMVLELLSDETRLRSMAAAARSRGAPEAADRIAAELLRLARGSRSSRSSGAASSGASPSGTSSSAPPGAGPDRESDS
ncbi:MAG: glycosyltransferase [Gemmatimonadota bacterium]